MVKKIRHCDYVLWLQRHQTDNNKGQGYFLMIVCLCLIRELTISAWAPYGLKRLKHQGVKVITDVRFLRDRPLEITVGEAKNFQYKHFVSSPSCLQHFIFNVEVLPEFFSKVLL